MESSILKTNADTTTILLIDDHPLLRYGIKQLLCSNPFLTVIAEASNGRDGLRLAEEYTPDLILLDLKMPLLSGIDTLKQLRARRTNSKVIVFSNSDAVEDVIDSMQVGVDGYLLKSIEPEHLLHAIQLVRSGVRVISPRVSYVYRKSQRTRGSTSTDNVSIQKLSHREIDVARLIAHGNSNKIISRKLFITEGTVKIHVKNILRKLGMKSRIEVAILIRDEKLMNVSLNNEIILNGILS
ncbi:response regulator [Aeromonas jandaei]|uniref:response regulator n=1 Tax=Aeromonas jandaei TaxID=650 RepID=UPI00398754BA